MKEPGFPIHTLEASGDIQITKDKKFGQLLFFERYNALIVLIN